MVATITFLFALLLAQAHPPLYQGIAGISLADADQPQAGPCALDPAELHAHLRRQLTLDAGGTRHLTLTLDIRRQTISSTIGGRCTATLTAQLFDSDLRQFVHGGPVRLTGPTGRLLWQWRDIVSTFDRDALQQEVRESLDALAGVLKRGS